MQVSSKSICVPEFLWKAYDEALENKTHFRIEVGDERKNIMKIDAADISLISIMEYVKEDKEEEVARRSGLLVPNRSGGGMRRLQ